MIKKAIKICTPKPLLRIMIKFYVRFIFRDSAKYVKPLKNTNAIDCAIAYNKFGAYCIPKISIDRPATQTIMRGDVWEEKTIKFIVENCKKGDIIHAGTYFGDFLPALSKNCHKLAKIWAFEPVREHYDCARVTILINKIDNVSLINCGLSDRDESSQMIVRDEDGNNLGGASKVVTNQEISTSGLFEPVNVIKLDNYIPVERLISVIHLDIEGFEQKALDGAMLIIKRDLPLLILETLPDNTWLKANLFSIGYQVKEVILGNTVLRHIKKA